MDDFRIACENPHDWFDKDKRNQTNNQRRTCTDDRRSHASVIRTLKFACSDIATNHNLIPLT